MEMVRRNGDINCDLGQCRAVYPFNLAHRDLHSHKTFYQLPSYTWLGKRGNCPFSEEIGRRNGQVLFMKYGPFGVDIRLLDLLLPLQGYHA